jgi:hypothetical protein
MQTSKGDAKFAHSTNTSTVSSHASPYANVCHVRSSSGYAAVVHTTSSSSTAHRRALSVHGYQYKDRLQADAAVTSMDLVDLPLEPEPKDYLAEWLQRLELTRPELRDGTAYHTMLFRALSALVFWCTALDPRQRPSMLMVACVLQVLPLGRWDRLLALVKAQRAKCPFAPQAKADESLAALGSFGGVRITTVDDAFLAALAARRPSD